MIIKLAVIAAGVIIAGVSALSISPDETPTFESVTRIVDGDTIYTTNHKIRLSLTDTPERGEKGWSEATEFTRSMCPVGSVVMIDQDDMQPKDRYDRTVAKVHCTNGMVNSELLYSGHAKISTTYCKTSEFAGEQWARDFGC